MIDRMDPTRRLQSTPATLPVDFSFSQSSLQSYVDCARRFWLTYIERLPWPAVQAAPVQAYEEQMRLGDQFHRLVQRVEIGMDRTSVGRDLPFPLDEWFAAYLTHRPRDLPPAVEVECVFSVSIPTRDGDQSAPTFRLTAKYDLVARAEQSSTSDRRIVIIDWKTGRHRPSPTTLRAKMQTLVYPFVLVEAAPSLGWGKLRPEDVEMRYWFTAEPDTPIVFRYDQTQHERARREVQRIIGAIAAGHDMADFPMAPDSEETRLRLCRYCVYRSRCDRGLVAGPIDGSDEGVASGDILYDLESAGLTFGLDDVPELAF
jgi:hypothetical protein